VSPTRLAIVVFTRHAERRLAERRLTAREIAELVTEHHGQRRRNPGDADWLIRARGIAVAYDWPDGEDETTAVVITAWRE
jgi:hypothetical protein